MESESTKYKQDTQLPLGSLKGMWLMEYVGIVRPIVAFHKQKAEKKKYTIKIYNYLSQTPNVPSKPYCLYFCEMWNNWKTPYYILGGVTPTKAPFSTFIL